MRSQYRLLPVYLSERQWCCSPRFGRCRPWRPRWCCRPVHRAGRLGHRRSQCCYIGSDVLHLRNPVPDRKMLHWSAPMSLQWCLCGTVEKPWHRWGCKALWWTNKTSKEDIEFFRKSNKLKMSSSDWLDYNLVQLNKYVTLRRKLNLINWNNYIIIYHLHQILHCRQQISKNCFERLQNSLLLRGIQYQWIMNELHCIIMLTSLRRLWKHNNNIQTQKPDRE